jgi:hypothetical protein
VAGFFYQGFRLEGSMMTDRQALIELQKRLNFIVSMTHRGGSGSTLSSLMECKRVIDAQLKQPQPQTK